MTFDAQPLIGKWRIDGQGGGEFVFGAVRGSLDCEYMPNSIDSTWAGHDEMDEAACSGSAELDDDGNHPGDLAFHRSDVSNFHACHWCLLQQHARSETMAG